ncbi:uncharacterized protein LOC121249345 [Juglans microcarpa x Juglans regia]|uniref:uncharacterized protein LOC121249345 n=1 Tax=Juglans microcarpa x Juglans regia TaxID=2249226 RepID=UPI001B7E4BB9|nr:uncharacterized protein LOC121249345 [Juglans microcarpa x Juglans regia]
MEETTAIMRSLWIRRKAFIFEKNLTSPSCVIRSAKNALNEFHQVQVLLEEQKGNRSAVGGEKRWLLPEQNMIKANWDAALDVKARKMGAGVIIRNEKAEVMATCNIQKRNVVELALAKCYALRKAMELCKDLNFDKVTFEGDAQVVINVVNDPIEDPPFNGSSIQEMKMVLKGWQGWKVQYSHRDTNVVAHKLQKAALHFEEEKVWIEEAPIFVLNSLQIDKHCIDQPIYMNE